MKKIIINNIEFRMYLKQLVQIINSGAFTPDTEIMSIDEQYCIIWKWNKLTHVSANEMFIPIEFDEQ